MKNTEASKELYDDYDMENSDARVPLPYKVKLKEIDRDKASAMCMLMTAVSLLGYIVECVFTAVRNGFIDNRNMFLPFLFGYGISVFVIYLLFGTPTAPRFAKYDLSCKTKILNTLVYFMLCFVIVSVGECVLGSFVEATMGIVWWNYTDLPLNITKYTSVPTSAAFAAMITLFMGCIFKPLYKAFFKMDKKMLHRLAAIFMVLLSLDFIHSGLVMINTGNLFRLWRINF